MLKYGYTTGTCAAIASRAAAEMIFLRKAVSHGEVLTPSGTVIRTEILCPEFDETYGKCGVKKDSGDDPDVTNGMLIFSEVTLKDQKGIEIDGGEGVGRVTKPGLSVPPGEAAINKVPREMITSSLEEVFESFGFEGGARVLISAPGGDEIAKRTFNPRLGIEGGISILGSSGLVKPMSNEAVIETIKADISVHRSSGEDTLILTPGNYGRDFIKENLDLDLDKAVITSNYIGIALDEGKIKGFKRILLIGHIGKLVKLAGGIMNTHSREGDCRMEILSSAALNFTDDIGLLRRISGCISTDEALGLLKEKGILQETMDHIGKKALFHMKNRLYNDSGINTGLIIFSNVFGVLYDSPIG